MNFLPFGENVCSMGARPIERQRLDAIGSHAGCGLGEAIKPLANNVSSAGLTPDQRR